MIFILSLLFGTGLVDSQFVNTPTNFTTVEGHTGINVRYKQVPAGICEQDPNVKSYSGFADVAEDEHIFWWFFESRNQDPTTAPLTVWINGGPGSSSMIGLFQELGPCGVDHDGNVYNNPYSWSNVSNMLFIDQPTTTGLSYSVATPGYIDSVTNDIIALPNNTCPYYVDPITCGTYNVYNTSLTANSTPAAAPNFYLTLQAFTGAFPQYSQNGLLLTTESYGGHYGPKFSQYILEQNEALKNATNGTAAHLDLKAVMIGNGWYDPLIQYAAYYNYSSRLSAPHHGNTYGIYYNDSVDGQVYNSMYGAGNCYDQITACNDFPSATYASDGEGNMQCSAADAFCYDTVELPYDQTFGRDAYDIRYLTPDPFPYNFYAHYLNNEKVQAAIGAFTNYSESSAIVGTAFASTGDDARELGVTSALKHILKSGLRLVMYFGDADYNCNWLGGQAVSFNLGIEAYNNGSAGFTNITTSDGTVHGQAKSVGNFSFARIYEAGHEVPFYQPLISLQMLNRTIHGVDIATGTTWLTDTYLTKGEMNSTYYEGNRSVTFSIIPQNATYNIDTNQPDPPYNVSPVAVPPSTSPSPRPFILAHTAQRLPDSETSSQSYTFSKPANPEQPARHQGKHRITPDLQRQIHTEKEQEGRHGLFDEDADANADGLSLSVSVLRDWRSGQRTRTRRFVHRHRHRQTQRHRHRHGHGHKKKHGAGKTQKQIQEPAVQN